MWECGAMWSCAVLLVLSVGACECLLNVDLGHDLNEDSMVWVTEEPLKMETRYKGPVDKGEGFWYQAYSFCTPEHIGTHMDAPSHFASQSWPVSEIPLEHLFGQGVVVDIRDKVQQDHNAELTAEDLRAWMDKYGPLPDGAVMFVRTGWGSRYGNKTAYFGTSTNNSSILVFPGIHLSAAHLLSSYELNTGNRIFGVGIDTPSIDHGPSVDFKTHVELFEANIYGLENVANLEKLPPRGFEVIVMPIKLTGGSGGPARIIARIPEETDEAKPMITKRAEEKPTMSPQSAENKSPTNSSPGQSNSHVLLFVLIALSCLLNSRCVV